MKALRSPVAWAVLAVAIPVGLTWRAPTQALDLAYQIRAGEVMLDETAVLRTDRFTYTVAGEPWLNQQWGAQVVLGAVHRAGGWAWLDLLRGALVGAVVWFVYAACRARGASPPVSCLLAVVGWLVAAPVLFQLRPQMLGTVGVAAVVWVLAGRSRSPSRLWAIPFITLVLANMHGSFPLALVLVGLAILEDRRDPGSVRRLTAVGLVSLVATALTPFGPRVWGYVVDLATDPIVAERIGEWSPPSLDTVTGVLFFASLVLVAGGLVLLRRGVRAVDLVELAVFAGLSAFAVRAVVWWAIVAPVVLAGVLARAAADTTSEPERRSMPLSIAAAVVCVAAIVGFAAGRGEDPATGAPKMVSFAPERLVEALRDAVPAGSRVFASQLHASWAELAAPGFAYMVDSRVELFPEAVWADYFTVSAGSEGWDAILDRDEVDAVLLEPGQASGLYGTLVGDDRWRLVAETESGAVYVRN